MDRFIEQHDGRTFDIVVIGGGITGAAVSYEAAIRGFSVALLEKNDFGGATSAATSKLIHGGLRYLANGEVGLVRESLRERRVLENIAPNLVQPLPCLIATYRGHGFINSRTAMRGAMMAYDVLSFDKGKTWDEHQRLPHFRSLSPREVLRLEPNVRSQDLDGGFIYYDCLNVFPERLTLAFIRSAARYGAKIANYARVDDFVVEAKRLKGVKVVDVLTDVDLLIKGSLFINCTGPWADVLLGKALYGEAKHSIRRSEGIHLITNKMVNDHLVARRTARGRHVFFIPWRGHTLVGTTDKEYIGSPDEYRVSRQSVLDLIDELNEDFGEGAIRFEDVRHAYGGLRPLVETQASGTYSSSRRYEVYDNAVDGIDGLITVEGGKYTTSRGLAEKVIRVAAKKSNRTVPSSVTETRFLDGCAIADMRAFRASVASEKSIPGLDWLGTAYGTQYQAILDIAQFDPSLAQPLNDDGEILAEVIYAIQQEMARTLADILLRRTGFGTLGHPGNDIIGRIADLAASELNWNSTKKDAEVQKMTEILRIAQ